MLYAEKDFEDSESPKFDKKYFKKLSLNTNKDECIEKLIAECERLSEIAQRKTAILA